MSTLFSSGSSMSESVTNEIISTNASEVSNACIPLKNSSTEVIDLFDEDDEVHIIQSSKTQETNTSVEIKDEIVNNLEFQESTVKKEDNEPKMCVVDLEHSRVIDPDDSYCESSTPKLKANGKMSNQEKESDGSCDIAQDLPRILSGNEGEKSSSKKRKSFEMKRNGSPLKKIRITEVETLLIEDDSNPEDFSDLKMNLVLSPAGSSKQSKSDVKKETSLNISASSDVIVLDSDDESVNLDDNDVLILTPKNVSKRKIKDHNISVEILSDKIVHKSVKRESKPHDVSVEILSERPIRNRWPAPVMSAFIPLTEETEDNDSKTPVQDENLFFEDKCGMGVRLGNRDELQPHVKRLTRDELQTTARKRSHINRFEKKPISRFERMQKITQHLKKQDDFSKEKGDEVQCLFKNIRNTERTTPKDNQVKCSTKKKDAKCKSKDAAATATKAEVELVDVNDGVKNVYNPETTKQTAGLRPIIIDGSNVALGHTNGKEFSCRGLAICIDYFAKLNHRVIAFVPKFRRSQAHSVESHILDKYEDANQVVYTPSRWINGRLQMSYDDRYIVQCAAELGGVIVSTDNFRDLSSENPSWREAVEKRLLMFTWVGDMLMFPQDPLGRNGPSLSEFLMFPE